MKTAVFIDLVGPMRRWMLEHTHGNSFREKTQDEEVHRFALIENRKTETDTNTVSSSTKRSTVLNFMYVVLL